MVLFIPLDIAPFLPFAGVLDKLLLDFDILDIVVWFPRLTWAEFGKAIGAVVLCKCASDQIETWALAPIKSRIKLRLSAVIAARWPQVAARLGLSG